MVNCKFCLCCLELNSVKSSQKTRSKMKKNLSIKLTKVSKQYQLHHYKPTLVDQFVNGTKTFIALDEVNLSIKKGEKIGVIGDNGAGKTTLLKIIAGITQPTLGEVEVSGKVVSLIDPEAGFHPDLTGEENIALNGLLIGMSKREILQKKQQIIEFANIGEFIHTPLYTYSAGMRMRLGFSVAIHSDPDILLLDEGVLAGDLTFRLKLNKKIDDLFESGQTVIVVSHWLEYLKEYCEKIIWIQKGGINKIGGFELIDEYEAC